MAQLGIGAAYTSPFLRACEGSSHGYDVVDHGHVDPSLGTEEDFGRFAEALVQQGLGLVVDIVPNHMGISDPHNGWWQDVLVNGPASTYARYFDIDWHPPKEALHNRVLLPVLGDQFGKVLEEQQTEIIAARKDAAAFRAKLAETENQRREIEQRIKHAGVAVYTAVGQFANSSVQQGDQPLFRLVDPANGQTVVYIRTSDSKHIAMLYAPICR